MILDSIDDEIEEAPRDSPPHSAQAEEAVLGSVLKSGTAFAEVAAWLKPQHFFDPRNRHDYAAMTALFERGGKLDYHMIVEELRRQGTYEAAGGLQRPADISLGTPSAAHIVHYGQIVMEHAKRRDYIRSDQAIAALGWDVWQPLETVKQRAEALVLGSSDRRPARRLARWRDRSGPGR